MSEFYEGEDIEKAEVEAEVQKEKNKKKKGKLSVLLAGGAIAIIFAIVAYWILLSAETAALSKYEKRKVYVLNQDIPKGMQILEPNIFSIKDIDATMVPENAVTNLAVLKDTYAAYNLSANSVITNDMFYSIDTAEKGNREVSFEIANLSGNVNGTIRASDFIDLYILTPKDSTNIYADKDNQEFPGVSDKDKENTETKESSDSVINTDKELSKIAVKPTYSKLYVSAVYTSDGVKIQNGDTTSIATRFTIVVPNDEADYIIGAFVTNNTVIMATKWTDKALIDQNKTEDETKETETENAEPESKATKK